MKHVTPVTQSYPAPARLSQGYFLDGLESVLLTLIGIAQDLSPLKGEKSISY